MDKIIDIFKLFKKEIKRSLNIDEDIEFDITLPKRKENGDISTNVALKLSSKLDKSPMDIADYIVKNIDKDIIKVDKIQIVAPGFVNFYLSDDWIKIIGDIVLNKGISIAQRPIEKNYTLDISSNTGVNSRVRAEAYLKVMNNIFKLRGFILEKTSSNLRPQIKLGEVKLLKAGKEYDVDINHVLDEKHINFYSVSKTYKSDIDINLDNAYIDNTSNPYFYITYICTRAGNIVNILEKQGYRILDEDKLGFSSHETLTSPQDRELIFKILQLEEVLDEAVKYNEPYKLFDYIYLYSDLFYMYNNELRLIDKTKAEILSNLYILKVVEKFVSNILELMLII